MRANAIVLEQPEKIALATLDLDAPGSSDVVVAVEASGVSAGTERLLWSGRMPEFPGMGYPLVPGYEAVGVVVEAGPESGRAVGDRVFAPGARCFGSVRGLFGAASDHLVLPGARTATLSAAFGDSAVLLALAATARHALAAPDARPPELIVGHGALGRLLARIAIAEGHAAPTVWERSARRRDGAAGYAVISPDNDTRVDYGSIYDASGDAGGLDDWMRRMAPGGCITLAGFYDAPVRFAFPPAFAREARLRIAAEWRPEDLAAVIALVESGALSLDGIVSHRRAAADAADAYATAFTDPDCLKMTLDWRNA